MPLLEVLDLATGKDVAVPGDAVNGIKVQVTSGATSNALTDTQLRATPVPISGTVTVTDGSGPLTVDGTVATTVADGANVTAGTKTDAAVTDSTASSSIIAALKGLLKLLSSSSAGGQGNKAVTTAATPVQLAASTACTNVIITARVGNTKQIAYGFSNAVRATAAGEIGAQLQPGDSVSLKVNNLNAVWIDAQVNGEGVSYTYTTD